MSIINPMLASGFLNPIPPPIAQQSEATQVGPPMTAPSPTGPPPQILIQIESLQAANFALQAQLETATEKVRVLDKERKDLLDRLEKALTIAAKLKDVERENIELKSNFEASEKELKKLYKNKAELEQVVEERAALLTDVRDKYFAERRRNESTAAELEVVKNVSESAKRELENQLDRVSLREAQLGTMRSLAATGEVVTRVRMGTDDELNMAATLYSDAMPRSGGQIGSTPMGSGGRLGSGHLGLGSGRLNGLSETTPAVWQQTAKLPPTTTPRVSENFRRLILAGSSRFSGTLLDDRTVRLVMDVVVDRDVATTTLSLTNTSPGILQSVRLLNATKQNSYFDFVFTNPPTDVFLRPGQQLSATAELRLVGVFDTATVGPTVCVSYTAPASIPTNTYLPVPIPVLKFVSPVRPSIEALLAKWSSAEFAESECVTQFAVQREELKSFASLSSLGEIGGSLMAQRGVDPNTRGQVFAGALPAGQHGNVKEVILRIELSPADARGPVLARVTVRSPSITLSKSVLTTALDVLV